MRASRLVPCDRRSLLSVAAIGLAGILGVASPGAGAASVAATDAAAATPTRAAGPAEPALRVGSETTSLAAIREGIAKNLKALSDERARAERQVAMEYQRSVDAAIEQEITRLVDERVLALEAAARKATPQKLLSELKVPPPTDEELRRVYESQTPPLQEPFEKLQSAIRDYVVRRDLEAATRRYYGELRARYGVEIHWSPARYDVAPVGPVRGPADAAITIVEFSDFQCPFCAQVAPVLAELQKRNPTQVRVVYRHLPLPSIHENALNAAVAAACADAQGRFWAMHDFMFANQDRLDEASLGVAARATGLDGKAFDACRKGSAARTIVDRDLAAASDLSLTGTPTLFLNGRFVNGSVSVESLQKLVDEELLRRAVAPTASAARATE